MDNCYLGRNDKQCTKHDILKATSAMNSLNDTSGWGNQVSSAISSGMTSIPFSCSAEFIKGPCQPTPPPPPQPPAPVITPVLETHVAPPSVKISPIPILSPGLPSINVSQISVSNSIPSVKPLAPLPEIKTMEIKPMPPIEPVFCPMTHGQDTFMAYNRMVLMRARYASQQK